ncbi:MAG: transposase [Acidobacteria bacterium]|nr:transposase [Acidobacteriota bacterium]
MISKHPIPLAYLLTFTCYGARLHGDESGSVDRDHRVLGTPFLSPNPLRVASEQKRAKQKPYRMDSCTRSLVLRAIQEVCLHRGWTLWASHVRSQHVHLVVAAEDAPEKILHDVKAYVSRALNRAGLGDTSNHRWTRHGSTRYLWKSEQIGAAIHYVVREQGEPMAVWEHSASF